MYADTDTDTHATNDDELCESCETRPVALHARFDDGVIFRLCSRCIAHLLHVHETFGPFDLDLYPPTRPDTQLALIPF